MMIDAEQNPTFFVSSRGHSATVWLATVLSSHPKIVAFHGCRSIPPYTMYEVPDMAPDTFIRTLIQCRDGCYRNKLFGAVHGYFGTLVKDACERAGGLFSWIVRHPVSWINSLFCFYAFHAKAIDPLSLPDVFSALPFGGLKNVVDRADVQIMADNPALSSELQSAVEIYTLFDNAVTEIISPLEDCWRNSGPKSAIKMEEMVASRAYFRSTVWPLVTNYIPLEDNDLLRMLDRTKSNSHARRDLSPSAVYAEWPEAFRVLLHDRFESSRYLKEILSFFDYSLPG